MISVNERLKEKNISSVKQHVQIRMCKNDLQVGHG